MAYDIERLKQDANAFDVADAIGMQVKKVGSVWYAECVSGLHNESQLNHNQLHKNGCYCYSCGKKYDVIGMVMEYYKNIQGHPISFTDACGIIADTCSAREDYYIKKGKGQQPPLKLLSKEEMEALGFCGAQRIKIVTSFATHKYEMPGFYDRSWTEYIPDGYAEVKAVPMNITNLYREDRTAFMSLLESKCNEKEQVYEQILDELTDKDEFGAVMRRKYQKMLDIIHDVRDRYFKTKTVVIKPRAQALFNF